MKNTFAQALLAWYDINKRTLPWRDIQDSYGIWVSETMLQQTRVETVLRYYPKFMELFPTIDALAQAPQQQVLKVWEGLGYYSRARNLQKGAQQVMAQWNGHLPKQAEQLKTISGIGPYTAGAIVSIAFQQPVPAIDGNVIRVISRIEGIRQDVGMPSTQRLIKKAVEERISQKRPGDFNQALMDLGASLCIPGTPDCSACPVQSHCNAFAYDDMEQLPIKLQARAPRVIPMAVGLCTCEDKVLVIKRKERLLEGLWVYLLCDEGDTKTALSKKLNTSKLSYQDITYIKEAKHVFTHQVWQMNIYHVPCREMKEIPGGQWITLAEMQKLPIPTAMKKAKELLRGLTP